MNHWHLERIDLAAPNNTEYNSLLASALAKDGSFCYLSCTWTREHFEIGHESYPQTLGRNTCIQSKENSTINYLISAYYDINLYKQIL